MTLKDGMAWLDAAAKIDVTEHLRLADVLGFGLILAAVMVALWVKRLLT
jgi:hypothetical protein